MNIEIHLSYQIISDYNGIMTVAFYIGNKMCDIVAGESYEILHKLERAFG